MCEHFGEGMKSKDAEAFDCPGVIYVSDAGVQKRRNKYTGRDFH